MKPGFILKSQLTTFCNSSYCSKSSLTFYKTFSKYFCSVTGISIVHQTSEAMASKNNKKPKLSDSESASSASASDSETSTPPRKDATTKSKQQNESKSKSSPSESSKGNTKSVRVAGEKEPTWELGGKKFVTINEFKGRTYVNIREYYEKDGKVLPGKKGISMNAEQWQNFCNSVEEVNQVLKK